MRKKRLLSLLGVGAAICLAKPHLLYANPTFGGGNGTESNPYRLSTPEHLTQLQVAVDGGNSFSGKYFILTNDIDFTGYDNDNDPSNGNFNPIGNWNSYGDCDVFSGNVNGDHHTISNLQIILPDEVNVGLFAYLEGGKISNLNLEEVNIQGTNRVGGLSSYLFESIVDNCSASGSVSGVDFVGGLVGYSYTSTVTQSFASGEVSGIEDVGGLVGKVYDSTVEQSSTSGNVEGESFIGGLIGVVFDSTVNQSYATGTVVGGAVGGLIGAVFDSTINQSYATGDVSGEWNVGGLIGAVSDSTINQSYATGDVLGEGNVGGLIGYDECSTIEQSVATGDVSGIENVGGLIGYDECSTIEQSVATGDISGIEGVGGLVGWTENSMIEQSSASGDVEGESFIGGLIGVVFDSTVNQSYATGDVLGEYDTGGLIGFGEGVTVIESFSQGQVNGIENVGGLIGSATQPLTIVDCYSLSDVTGELTVGGLVGAIDDSYSSNEVALIKNSYYDGIINGTQDMGKLIGQLGYYDKHSDVWCDGSVSMEKVYLNQEKNSNYPLVGDTTHGTIVKEDVVELTTTQMSQSNSKNHMTALDFETIWMTTSTTPMFQWQNDLVSANQGDIQINGNVQPMIADVTIPSVSPDLVIDPNSPDGAVSPEFEIQNDSNSPIRLELKTFEQITNSFNDVLPDKYDSWEGLNKKESKDIALGLVAKEGEGWQRLTNSTSYVANHTEHEIGVMKPMSQVNFEFEVHHGRAFSESKTIQYKMVFVFDLLN